MTARLPTRQHPMRLLLLVDGSAGLALEAQDMKNSSKIARRLLIVVGLRNLLSCYVLWIMYFYGSALVRERGNRPGVASLGRMMIPVSPTDEIYCIFSFGINPIQTCEGMTAGVANPCSASLRVFVFS